MSLVDESPRPFGFSLAAFAWHWVYDDAMAELRSCPALHLTPEDASRLVARTAVEHLSDWWSRFPACAALLEDSVWYRYLHALAVRLLEPLHPDGEVPAAARDIPQSLELRLELDKIERVAANAIADNGEPLVDINEQVFLHLRYRLGLTIENIADVLGITDEYARTLGQRANWDIQEALAQWDLLHPDPDSDPDSDAEEDGDG